MNSAIQILEQTPNRLMAYDPPYALAGWAFIGFAIAMCVLGVVLFWKAPSKTNALIFLVAAIFALIGGGALTGHSTITFSRQTGQVRIEKSYFGKIFSPSVVQIADIQSVEVRTTRNLRKVALLLRSGDLFLLTSGTDRPGYQELANAVQQFLQNSPTAEVPVATSHRSADHRRVTMLDAEAMRKALEDFFVRTSRDDLKKEWPEGIIDTMRQAISPATIDAQGTGRIGRWLIEPQGDHIWLTYTWTAGPESDRRFRFYVIVEKTGATWKAVGHGREESWRK